MKFNDASQSRKIDDDGSKSNKPSHLRILIFIIRGRRPNLKKKTEKKNKKTFVFLIMLV